MKKRDFIKKLFGGAAVATAAIGVGSVVPEIKTVTVTDKETEKAAMARLLSSMHFGGQPPAPEDIENGSKIGMISMEDEANSLPKFMATESLVNPSGRKRKT